MSSALIGFSNRNMNPKKIVATFVTLPLLSLLPTISNAGSIPLVNGDFETGVTGSSAIAGWEDRGPSAGFWLQDGLVPAEKSPTDPTGGADGSSLYLTANFQAAIPNIASQANGSTISQTVGLGAANIALVAAGFASLELDFYHSDVDPGDSGFVTVVFLDSG